MAETATVFVVDDDASVRKALGRLLTSMELCVETFASAGELLTRDLSAVHGCILLDIKMPAVSGLDLQSKLLDAGIELPVIFLSAHADVPVAVRAMKAGAVDVLTKPFKGDQLLDTVRRAIATDEVRVAARRKYEDLRQRFGTLTPREHTVFSLVVSGMRNREIAVTLGTSLKTVKVHRARVMEKMQAPSLPELVRLAHFLGLLPSEIPEAGVPKVQ
jgi:FixJ family two-component response regulator